MSLNDAEVCKLSVVGPCHCRIFSLPPAPRVWLSVPDEGAAIGVASWAPAWREPVCARKEARDSPAPSAAARSRKSRRVSRPVLRSSYARRRSLDFAMVHIPPDRAPLKLLDSFGADRISLGRVP